MAIRVLANSASIMRPPSTAPFNITGDIELVVNSTPVGFPVGRVSKKADIELVQFYLSEFFDNVPNVKIPKNYPRSANREMVKIDGKLGGQTNAAIEVFQQHLNQRQTVDKIVSVPSIVSTGKEHPEVASASFFWARSILVLASTWVAFHPKADILDNPKLQNANNLKMDLMFKKVGANK
jgi:peptidoglycan hydrolase-like protein with peptidoglycan-binding domain